MLPVIRIQFLVPNWILFVFFGLSAFLHMLFLFYGSTQFGAFLFSSRLLVPLIFQTHCNCILSFFCFVCFFYRAIFFYPHYLSLNCIIFLLPACPIYSRLSRLSSSRADVPNRSDTSWYRNLRQLWPGPRYMLTLQSF